MKIVYQLGLIAYQTIHEQYIILPKIVNTWIANLQLAIKEVDDSVTTSPIVVLHIYGQMAPRFPETQL